MSQMRGIEQFRKRLEAMDKKIRNKTIKDALKAGAKVMAKAVRERARVKTGALKKSVKPKVGKRKKDTLSYRVVITGGHPSPMVAAEEYGTVNEAPHPFIRPGFEASKDDVFRLMIDQIRTAIESPDSP